MDREYILRLLRAQINVNGHIIGAAVGSGMTAKFAAMGGADLLLALSAGKYRIMGRSSFASYFCYGNSNEQVMEMGQRELFPIIKDTPIVFGLMANDPSLHLYEHLKAIKEAGFSGIVNFPTMALIDGQFREALEEEGNTYKQEVEAIHLAFIYDCLCYDRRRNKADDRGRGRCDLCESGVDERRISWAEKTSFY